MGVNQVEYDLFLYMPTGKLVGIAAVHRKLGQSNYLAYHPRIQRKVRAVNSRQG